MVAKTKESNNKKTSIAQENIEPNHEDNNSSKEEKTGRKIRKCLKKEPLQPLNMGTIIRKKQKKGTKSVKPKFTAKKSMKTKMIKPKSNSSKANLEGSSKSKSKTSMIVINNKQIKPKSSKAKSVEIPQITVSDEFDSEVVFNPQSDCAACQDGRKGEGDQSCWACRLSRLLAITEYKISKETKQQ